MPSEQKLSRLLLVLLLGCWALGAVAASPKIESWITSKGARVMFVHSGGLPMLDVRVVFDAGSARDGETPGLAVFTNAMLTQGAGHWDANQLAQRLDSRGIQLGAGALRDMAWVSVRTLSEPPIRKVAVATLAKILSSPRFDAAAIDRVRQQMLVGLRQAEQSPAEVASRRFYRTLYGDHPYAHAPDGSAGSLQTINASLLHVFLRKYYVAANAVIAIVGDVDRKQAEQIAERITAGLQRGRHAPPLPQPQPVPGGELRQRFPSSQTHILLGELGVARGDPDWFPLYVGNHILGGSGLVSILGEQVRNKRGLAYSVGSSFIPMRVAGPFLITAQTRNAKAGETLRVLQHTLAHFVLQGPTRQQLERAKRNIIGSFPLAVADNADIVNYISMIGFYGLPTDWLDTFTRKVAKVSLQQVRDAFARHVTPAHEIAVVVGGKPGE